MDESSFSLAGPSNQYGSGFVTAAELAGTVSPASLNILSSHSSQLDLLGYRPEQRQKPAQPINGPHDRPEASGSSLKRAFDRDTADQASSLSPPASAVKRAKSAKKDASLVQPHQDLNEFLEEFWTRQINTVEEEDVGAGYALPLARIKKVMKSDEDVRMISAEVPIMFSKACEIFISELTCRAWLVAEGQKRRTLQKSDVAAAIAHSDMFDFLIDIIPRDEDEEGGGGEVALADQDQEQEQGGEEAEEGGDEDEEDA